MSVECGREEGKRTGGREEGGNEKQDSHLVSYSCIIQKGNGELGEVVDMDEVKIVYALSAE